MEKIKVDLVTTWDTNCGMAYHCSYLVRALRKHVDVTVCRVDPSFTKQQFLEAVDKCDGDVVHVEHEWGIYNGYEDAILDLLAKKQKSVVVTVHGGNYQFFFDKVAKIAVPNESQREGAPPEHNIAVLPHGATRYKRADKIASRKIFGVNRQYVVTQWGFILPHKFYELTLHAIQDLKDVCFLIAGSEERNPQYWMHLQKLIKELNVKAQVVKTGFVPENQITNVFGASDLCLFPYTTGVDSGCLRYALGSKVLSLASPQKFINEIFKSYGVPFVSRPPWMRNWKSAIRELLKLDDLSGYERRCRNFYKDYNWNKVAKKHIKVYQQIKSMLLDHPEAKFIKELRRLKGGLFVDVGANAGYYTLNLANRFREVWAVEPYGVFVEKLKRNIKRFNIGNVKVIEKAISDKVGTQTFYGNIYVPLGRDCPSLKQDLTLSYEGKNKCLPVEVGKVEVVSLTDLIGPRKVDLIKVDTEGNERQVLWGAESIMDQIGAWHIEVHDWRETEPITEYLTSCGYAVRERGLDGRNKGWLLAKK